MLAFDGILYPNFAVFSADSDFETGGNLRMPLFVKPLRGGRLDRHQRRRRAGARFILADGAGACASTTRRRTRRSPRSTSRGASCTSAVIGNLEPEALPPIELDLSGLPDHMPPVADNAVKFDEALGERYGIEARVAELPDELRARLQKVAVQAYRALRVRDYGRVDLRLTEAGEIYVLEVNANCYLEDGQEFAMAAAAAGYDYATMLEKIVQLAVERQGVEPRRARRRTSSRRSAVA